MGVQDRPQCYFDVEINREPVGRIVFQLFSDVCPKTCTNFLGLCTGEKGRGKTTGKKLCYKGSTFHRIVKNFMIQGGDFIEGNGRGGESIYGGYFEDENFVLKHDRAFLLSMANRGKDTNGSQFFITTKTAPHLDGVHVVFGLVISGFEVIKHIENLKTDAASRPYADVRVIDCGQLTKPANDVLERRKKISPHSWDSSSSSSTSESQSDTEEKQPPPRKRKRRTRYKHLNKRRKEGKRRGSSSKKPPASQTSLCEQENADDDKGKDLNVKREKPVVRPEEIPPVPENRFLLRRDMQIHKTEPAHLAVSAVLSDQKPAITKSGRKIKGRGTMRYHTPPRSRSRSQSQDDDGDEDEKSSETPPHWKEEMQRTKIYQPPSGEKWSKGDKLNDHYSSRWEGKNASPWSRSRSHDYCSDHSTERASQNRRHKKEKRAKHRKKSKKQKHSKKLEIPKTKPKTDSTPHKTESSRSSSRKSKLSIKRERRSRSCTISSRRSSRRDWSGSDKIRRSSPLSRNSSSYSRSKSRSRSYSRSRSRSRSRTRSRSLSRSRSRSISRSRKRTSSRSPRNTRSNENNKSQVDPPRQNTQTNENVLPNAISESVPALPMSDSPPPSRWKPGQKPWKPSYVNVQEIKAKTPALLAQSSYTVKNSKENSRSSSYHDRHRHSDSERSVYSSDRSYNYKRRSRTRSSRSRSYRRSYSRSRSRGRYSSRSHTPVKYHSRSSSYSRSNSYDSYNYKTRAKSNSRERGVKHNNAIQESSPEATFGDRYLDNRKELKGEKENHRLYSSEYSTDSEKSNVKKNKKHDAVSKKQNNKSHSQSEADSIKTSEPKQKKHNTGSFREDQKSKSGWDSDSDNSKKEPGVEDGSSEFQQLESGRTNEKTSPGVEDRSSEFQQLDSGRTDEKTSSRKAFLSSKWDSEDHSETEEKKINRGGSAYSSKEEGEASSESDSEGGNSKSSKMSTRLACLSPANSETDLKKTSKKQTSIAAESSVLSSGSEKVMPKKKAKRKRKHKKRSSTKAGSRRGKTKSKGKKSKKKKQKPKETFHWQPPLEFGEEEEEERPEENVTVKQVVKEGLLKVIGETAVKHKESKSNAVETHKTPKENIQSGAASQRAQEQSTKNEQESKQSPMNVRSPRRGESTEAESSEVDGKELAEEFPEKTEQSDDSMEICTPEQNSPERDYAKTTLQQGSPLKEHVLPTNRDTENALNTTIVEALKMEPHPMNSRASSNVLVSNDSGDENDKAQNELQCLTIDPKWKPLKDLSNQQPVSSMNAEEVKSTDASDCAETKPQGLRIEIKSKSRVRPGSLFDEVRKTARLNQRQRNQESSSEERSPSIEDKSKSRSRTRSPSKSGSSQQTRSRTRSLSSSRSRTRSRSSTYSYRSRSYTRSRSRRRYSRGRSRTRSSTDRSYRRDSHSSRTYSRSRSRSRSSNRRRRSRSVTYDSYYSRSRSRSSRRRRSDSYRRSRSYDRSSRSYRSYSRSDRSYSRRRSHS
ncbi:NK-tumor recognition protein isoform X1 [Acipenser ruthenus]|uniref:NK-tumor recognition protein isoform X1 n=3 Tax=Acipenser ruthenus TaxID=7906 RepID=UPI00145A8BC2|nr:NK-tumor recognition protein isoform X1 [Acipenser ruthenus]